MICPTQEEAKWFKEFQEATRNWVADLEKQGLAGQGSGDHVQQDSRKPWHQGCCRPAGVDREEEIELW